MKKIQLTLDLKTYKKIARLAKLSGLTKSQVIALILALEVLKNK